MNVFIAKFSKIIVVKKIIIGILLSLWAFQQASAQNIQVGLGIGYDMSINFDDNQDYEVNPLGSLETTSIASMDVFIKIPITNEFNLYPSVMFTISKGHLFLENLNAEYVPPTVSVPYSTVGNGWSVYHYSNDYVYSSSDCYVSQTNVGGFITKNITENIEVGAGVFIKTKKYEIENYKARIQYIWESSTGVQYDNYGFIDNTVFSTPFETKVIKTSHISVPLILQYNGLQDSPMSCSLITHISTDSYFQVRITYAINVKKLKRNNS